MAYQALYRKWRPQTFDDMVGQSAVTHTLKNAISNHKTSHAYLFTGPRGTGKTSAAKVFAKAINCPNQTNGEPCNECEICKGITNGTIGDVIEIDAASNNGVEEIRDIRDKARYAPTQAEYKRNRIRFQRRLSRVRNVLTLDVLRRKKLSTAWRIS